MLHTFDGEMVVTEAQPVIDALDLSHEVAERYLMPGTTWSGMIATVSERVGGVIAANGACRLTETKAVFVCRAQPAGLVPIPLSGHKMVGPVEAPSATIRRRRPQVDP